jgi:Raf kinase inhibitor-like YbhB/YbcL family protein
MQITSEAFADGQSIPKQYTCDDVNSPPPLVFHGVPPKAKSLALIATDPDAPSGTFTHWLVWNIPPNSTSVAGMLGTNDFGKDSYGGPCPPSGEHRYVFTLYALDAELQLPSTAKRSDVEAAMKGHILAEAKLTGKYRRSR